MASSSFASVSDLSIEYSPNSQIYDEHFGNFAIKDSKSYFNNYKNKKNQIYDRVAIMTKLEISNKIDNNKCTGNMYRRLNHQGEKINVILNGIKETEKMLEVCPVDHYIVHMKN